VINLQASRYKVPDIWDVYSTSCSFFCEIALGYNVDDKRIERFLDTKEREVIALFSRQVGKTHGAAGKVVHKALFKKGSLSLIVSATQRQAGILQRRALMNMRKLDKGGEWREVPGKSAEIPEDIGGKLVRCSSLSLELENGSEIISVPASADTVRGYAPDLVIIDEAAYTPDDVYFAVRPMMIRTKGQLCLMSSAGAMQGFFYDAWTKDAGWEKLEIRADQCAWITADELQRERDRLPEKVFQLEY